MFQLAYFSAVLCILSKVKCTQCLVRIECVVTNFGSNQVWNGLAKLTETIVLSCDM